MSEVSFNPDKTPASRTANTRQPAAQWPAWDGWEDSERRANNRSNDKRYPPGYVYKEGWVICVSCGKQVRVRQDGRKEVHRGRRQNKANCRGSGKLIRSKKTPTNQ